jgi:hypothetical protein
MDGSRGIDPFYDSRVVDHHLPRLVGNLITTGKEATAFNEDADG